MTDPVEVHQVDVFTRVAGLGNPAGLSEKVMQAVAREVAFSEAAFVFAEEESGVVPVRFFTPECEVPACGHATLGAHYVRAGSLGLVEGEIEHRSPGARWSVRWEERDGGTFVVMRQGPVERGLTLDAPLVVRLCQALGTCPDALEEHGQVRVLSTGRAKVLVPFRESGESLRLQPDMSALAALSAETGVGGYLVFAPGDEGDLLTVCRMFGPAIGVLEDPVNGSGHGPLGAYLLDGVGAAPPQPEKASGRGWGEPWADRAVCGCTRSTAARWMSGGYVTSLAARSVAVQ